jgi:hypothetical protein
MMEKPGDNDEIRLVAILRTLEKSQDYTAATLKMGKERVVKIESWLKDESYDSVASLFLPHLLQKAVDEKLAETKILPSELVRAARLTGDQILEYYDQRPVDKPANTGNPKLTESHQDDLVLFANDLIGSFDPHLWAFPLRDLGKQGEHSISQKIRTSDNYALSWRNEKGNIVSITCGLDFPTEPKNRIIYGYFEQHVYSSSCAWLLESKERGIKRLRYLGGEELYARAHLLRQIDRDVTKLIGRPLVEPNLVHDIGPSTWFSESIWSAALDSLYCSLEYKTEATDSGLFKAGYGASILGLTANREEAEQYIKWHQQLMAKYSRSKAVKAVIRLAAEREAAAKRVSEVLTRWVVDRHVLGKCDYEFCCG